MLLVQGSLCAGLVIEQRHDPLCRWHAQVSFHAVRNVAAKALAQVHAIFHGEVLVMRSDLIAHALEGLFDGEQPGGTPSIEFGSRFFKRSTKDGQRRWVKQPRRLCASSSCVGFLGFAMGKFPAQCTAPGDGDPYRHYRNQRLNSTQQNHDAPTGDENPKGDLRT